MSVRAHSDVVLLPPPIRTRWGWVRRWVGEMDHRGYRGMRGTTTHPPNQTKGSVVVADLDMLKSVTDRTAATAAPGGRFDPADEAVENVLRVLYETPQAKEMWLPIYEAVKSAYVGSPEWGGV